MMGDGDRVETRVDLCLKTRWVSAALIHLLKYDHKAAGWKQGEHGLINTGVNRKACDHMTLSTCHIQVLTHYGHLVSEISLNLIRETDGKETTAGS